MDLMIEGKQQQIDNRKRKYGQWRYKSGAQQKPRFTPKSGGHFQHTRGGGSSHNHNGPKNGNGNGGRNDQNRTNPSTPAKSLALGARRPDIMPMNVLKPKMEMAMEALGTPSTTTLEPGLGRHLRDGMQIFVKFINTQDQLRTRRRRPSAGS